MPENTDFSLYDLSYAYVLHDIDVALFPGTWSCDVGLCLCTLAGEIFFLSHVASVSASRWQE